MAEVILGEALRLPEDQKYSDLFDRIVAEEDAPTEVRQPVEGLYVEFSNTGRRSNGWFVLTIDQLVSAIQNLLENREVICAHTGSPAVYDETSWRDIFDTYFTDDVARTMGKVQTLPLFELLSKVIHFSNSNEARNARALDLEPASLTRAIEAVVEWKAIEERRDAPRVADGAAVHEGGENVIFYGAPGTGKSNRVESKVKEAGKRPFRTVFHPDLQSSDFFGCLKPKMDGKDVIYGFSPGPFMQALAEAYKTPGEPVFLVVEELNRAAAAAVFGDLFLLLDRDEDGQGEYDVDFPSTESKEWFEWKTGAAHDKLRLPSNLFIYATMNSADQGVYPIDTAFRRRWRQEYLPLDYKSGPDGDVGYVDATAKHRTMAWRDFVRLLNGYLTKDTTLRIAEDRLLGQWFVKANELDGTGIPDKVLLYLWDDLLRHEGRPYLFGAVDGGEISTYGGLVLEAKEGRRFFSDAFLAELNKVSVVDDDEAAEPDDNAG